MPVIVNTEGSKDCDRLKVVTEFPDPAVGAVMELTLAGMVTTTGEPDGGVNVITLPLGLLAPAVADTTSVIVATPPPAVDITSVTVTTPPPTVETPSVMVTTPPLNADDASSVMVTTPPLDADGAPSVMVTTVSWVVEIAELPLPESVTTMGEPEGMERVKTVGLAAAMLMPPEADGGLAVTVDTAG